MFLREKTTCNFIDVELSSTSINRHFHRQQVAADRSSRGTRVTTYIYHIYNAMYTKLAGPYLENETRSSAMIVFSGFQFVGFALIPKVKQAGRTTSMITLFDKNSQKDKNTTDSMLHRFNTKKENSPRRVLFVATRKAPDTTRCNFVSRGKKTMYLRDEPENKQN